MLAVQEAFEAVKIPDSADLDLDFELKSGLKRTCFHEELITNKGLFYFRGPFGPLSGNASVSKQKKPRRLESASSLLVTRCDRGGEIIEMTCRRARHFDDQGNSYVVLLCDFRTS